MSLVRIYFIVYLWFSHKSEILSELVFILEVEFKAEFFPHLADWFSPRTVATGNCLQIRSLRKDIRNERPMSEERAKSKADRPASRAQKMFQTASGDKLN